MTRVTPGPSRKASTVTLRQMAASSSSYSAAAAAAYYPPFIEPTRSRSFVLSDLEGRLPPTVEACARCISELTPFEAAQASWRLAAADEQCYLCRVAACSPEAFTKPFCDFLRENPTVFHAVDYFKTKLRHMGFSELPARDDWSGRLKPGGKYWVTRNGSTIIAFTVGKAYRPGNGVAMVAGHVDALTARLKPISKKPTRAGYLQLGVAPYAGGLNQTWWDRDLSIGGRVIVRDPETGKTRALLVKLDWPVANIPTLAPHFGVGMFGSKNKETEAVPIIGLEKPEDEYAVPLASEGCFANSQPPRLVKMVARELGLDDLDSILDWDLELYDAQPAQTCGLDRELISGGRIDDKLCSWSAIVALLASDHSNDDDGHIRLVALFDEEIGSFLRQGARGNLLPSVIERAVESLSPPSTFGPGILGQTYARSFLISADVSHAGNPNFLNQYLEEHIPRLNVGMVVSGDSNGNMTTDGVSSAILRRVADLCGAKIQHFQIRNDSRSGGTIGPSLSSVMGVRAADAGLPQLSMHSVRATTGALDPGLGVGFFKGFFDYWPVVDGEWE